MKNVFLVLLLASVPVVIAFRDRVSEWVPWASSKPITSSSQERQATPEEETVGARLRRECASIIDEAGGAAVSQVQIVMVLEERDDVARELQKKRIPSWSYSQKVDALRSHPAWEWARREAYGRARERMIRECILRRGIQGG